MKITIDGKQFELVDIHDQIHVGDEAAYILKPVKKTEKKTYKLRFHDWGNTPYLYMNELDLTPTTAHKLSEAISALVEYMEEDYPVYKNREILMNKINEARKSFQESQ